MVTRMADGSAGDANYAAIGAAYTQYRRPDRRIAAQIAEALGAARTVLNVGAGAGSYEPADRDVTPVEPSASMRAKRPAARPAALGGCVVCLPATPGWGGGFVWYESAPEVRDPEPRRYPATTELAEGLGG